MKHQRQSCREEGQLAYESRDRTVIVAVLALVIIAALIFVLFWALGNDNEVTPTRTETIERIPDVDVQTQPTVPFGGGNIITVPTPP
jgi:hypothetical protein